jgi:glycosyltransferase involved in cell wall biosynthesis
VTRNPLVTCVIPAYNYGRYLPTAIDSALAQDYPADALEIIVVDDGSTDDTPQVVVPYLDRVRYIRKANGGLLSTVNRGIAEANGEFIALLSADDAWAPAKTRRQVEFLVQHPEVGLVHSDMSVVDDDGNTVHPSFLRAYQVPAAAAPIMPMLLQRNVVSGGPMMVRASLVPTFHPIPEDSAAWEDWWIAFHVAQVAEIGLIDEPLYLYRSHGENMNLGASGEKLRRLVRAEIPFRRYMLTTVSPASVAPDALMAGQQAMMRAAAYAAEGLGQALQDVVPVDEAQRAASIECVESAEGHRVAGNLALAAYELVVALAHDPWNPVARERLVGLTAPQTAAEGSEPELAVRAFAVVAFADELVGDPRLLQAFGRAFGADDDATLVIYAPGADEAESGARIAEAVERAGMGGADAPDMLALMAPADEAAAQTLARAVAAVLSERPAPALFADLPRVGADGDGELRRLADARTDSAGVGMPVEKGAVDVSVIVPVEGDLSQAWRCLLSLARLPELPQHEVVVVDNAAAGIEQILEQLGGDVVVARTGRRVGFAGSAAAGAVAASGDVLVFLRGVPEVCDNWLKPLSDAALRDGVAVAVSVDATSSSAHPLTAKAFAVSRAAVERLGGIPEAPDDLVLAALAASLRDAGELHPVAESLISPAGRHTVAARHTPGTAPELTVIIPTLDSASARVRGCLAAVAATTDVPHEVIVLDNGSPPQGYTAPVNAGIRASRGRYLVVMNDDVEPLPGWWPPLREALDAGASVAFPMTVDGRMRDDFAAWCFALRRDTAEQFAVAPGEFFDPRFTVWFQDTDLLVRLLEAGCPPQLVDTSQIRHGLSETVNSTDPALRAWIDAQVVEDEKQFRAKHPDVRLTNRAA